MGVKNHSGEIQRIRTWNNSHGEFEMRTFGDDDFLWHFAEDSSTDELVEGRFYCPVYTVQRNGRQVRQSKHLFYILNRRDEEGDAVFLEIGPDGFVNTACQPTSLLVNDVKDGNLLPMWRVSSFGKPPEETISLLRKLRPAAP